MKKIMLITMLMMTMLSLAQTDTTENVYYRGDMVINTGMTMVTVGFGSLLYSRQAGKILIVSGSATTIVGLIVRRRDGNRRRKSI